MKILRIIARLNVGGPARHVVWLTSALNNDEFETRLVAGTVPEGEEDMGYLADESDVRPIFIEEMSRELSAKDVISLLKVLSLVKREKPDVICTHTAKAGTIGRAAAFLYKWLTPTALIGRPRKIAVVHTFHGHVFHSYYGKLKTRFFVVIEKLLARMATDRIVVISEQQFTEIHRQVGVGTADQFSIVKLGIDLEPYERAAGLREQARRELEIDPSAFVVAFVGRLTEIKNVSMYIDAAEIFRRKALGTDLAQAVFLIAGDGHLRSGLQAEAELRNLKNVRFLGNRKNIEQVYAAVDIVGLTSLNEGTPLSLIEGMATMRPFVSTKVGGVADLMGLETDKFPGFTVHERGLAVASGDAEGFANGLIYLAKNERLRNDLSDHGHKFVKTEYSKERLADDLARLYRSVVK